MNEIHNFLEFFVNERKSGKMNFPLGKMEFWTHCNVTFIEKHLKNKEIEYLIHYAKFKMWPTENSAHITALEKALLVRLYLLYLTKNLKPLDFYIFEDFSELKTYL